LARIAVETVGIGWAVKASITHVVKLVLAVILRNLIRCTRILTECSAKNKHPREEHTWLRDSGIHGVNTKTLNNVLTGSGLFSLYISPRIGSRYGGARR
jgi:hypothetical protein